VNLVDPGSGVTMIIGVRLTRPALQYLERESRGPRLSLSLLNPDRQIHRQRAVEWIPYYGRRSDLLHLTCRKSPKVPVTIGLSKEAETASVISGASLPPDRTILGRNLRPITIPTRNRMLDQPKLDIPPAVSLKPSTDDPRSRCSELHRSG